MEYYYIASILIAATVTIIPKVLPLYFLKGKEIKKEMLTFFKIVPYTSMTILIMKYVITAQGDMFTPILLTVVVSSIVSYITENMIATVFTAMFTTFLCLQFL